MALSLAIGIFAQVDSTAFGPAEMTLQGSTSLHAVVTSATVTGSPTRYVIDYAKGSKFRIETSKMLEVCNGKTLWTLNKVANTYTISPESLAPTQLPSLLLYAGFFARNPFIGATDIEDGGTKTLHGVRAKMITVKLASSKEVRIFVRSSDKVPIGEQYFVNDGATTVIAKSVALSGSLPSDDLFSFAPPPNSKFVKPAPISPPYSKVDAIFQASCVGCHGGSGGLTLSSYTSLMQGGNSGKEVIAGDPKNSILYQYITGQMMPQMPKNSGPLSASQIKTIHDWIKAGAKGP